MGAIRDKIEDVREDLRGLGITAALTDQLDKLEQEAEDASKIDSAYDYEDRNMVYSKLEGYRLALKILEDALVFEV